MTSFHWYRYSQFSILEGIFSWHSCQSDDVFCTVTRLIYQFSMFKGAHILALFYLLMPLTTSFNSCCYSEFSILNSQGNPLLISLAIRWRHAWRNYVNLHAKWAVTLVVISTLQAWACQLPSQQEKLWFSTLDFIFLRFWLFSSAIGHFSHIGHAWFLVKYSEIARQTMHFHVFTHCLNVPSSKTWKTDQTWIVSHYRCHVFNFCLSKNCVHVSHLSHAP